MTEIDSKSGSRQSAASDSIRADAISSERLLGKKRHLTIEHNGERYLLRITSNNKLILTK